MWKLFSSLQASLACSSGQPATLLWRCIAENLRWLRVARVTCFYITTIVGVLLLME